MRFCQFVFFHLQILSNVPQLVDIFAQVASSPEETPEVKTQIGRAFSHLMSVYGHQMQPLLGNLSPSHANALAAIAPKSWRINKVSLQNFVLFVVRSRYWAALFGHSTPNRCWDDSQNESWLQHKWFFQMACWGRCTWFRDIGKYNNIYR